MALMKKELSMQQKTIQFVCHLCEKTYSHKWSLKNHIKVVHGPDKLQCLDCKKCFARKMTLREHMEMGVCNPTVAESYHEQHPPCKEYKCPHCHNCFSNCNQLRKHKNRCGYLYNCSKCDINFKHISSYKRHKQKHDGKTLFECIKCGVSYRHKDELKSHFSSVCKITGKVDLHTKEVKEGGDRGKNVIAYSSNMKDIDGVRQAETKSGPVDNVNMINVSEKEEVCKTIDIKSNVKDIVKVRAESVDLILNMNEIGENIEIVKIEDKKVDIDIESMIEEVSVTNNEKDDIQNEDIDRYIDETTVILEQSGEYYQINYS